MNGPAVAERNEFPNSTAPKNAARHLQLAYAALTVGLPTLGALLAALRAYQKGVATYEWTLFLVMYVATGLGIEAGFHRYFSHHAFSGRRFTTYLLGILGSMAGQGPILFWAAIHRQHHAATDRDGDPHSPYVKPNGTGGRLSGLLHAHVGWLFEPAPTNWARMTPDLLRDRDIIRLNLAYPRWALLGLAIPALVGFGCAGLDGAWGGLLWGGLLRIAALDHVTWGVNSVGHYFGSQAFRSSDQSRNVAWLALPSMGGAWHNNHHAFPASATLDFKFYQLDFSGLFIRFLQLIGLAFHLNRPSAKKRQQRQ